MFQYDNIAVLYNKFHYFVLFHLYAISQIVFTFSEFDLTFSEIEITYSEYKCLFP